MDKLINLLNTFEKITKTPVAYSHFDKKTEVPFLVWYEDGSNNFGADNRVFKSISSFVIEMYDRRRNLALESKLESLFFNEKIFFEKATSFISEERLFVTYYYISLIFENELHENVEYVRSINGMQGKLNLISGEGIKVEEKENFIRITNTNFEEEENKDE